MPHCDGVGWISDDGDEGRALRLDGVAASADPELPAFLAKPEGAPVYHGFPVLDDVDVHGFRLGMITDWEADSDDAGDAFIVAPDGSRCGLVWEVTATPRFEQVLPFEPGRWGVWSVGFPHPMDSREKARQNLMHLLPQLRERWESWRRGSGSK